MDDSEATSASSLRSSVLPRSDRDGDEGVDTQLLRARLQERLFDEAPAPVRIDRFEVLQRLGEGGMGVVYAVHDPRLDRRVAVKLLHPGADVPTATLLGEARALARLSHPHVVTVYEVGTVDDAVFLAMEYLDGGTLADWLRAHPVRTRGDVARVLGPLLAAGRGLAAAHAAGLVHRDFKPSNVLRGLDGRLKVADFGLARARVGSDLARGETTGIGGTPAYMAPEQFDGHADARADQFAFCVCAWEALFGVRPHAGTAVLGGDPPVPPRGAAPVPRALWSALRRGLAPRPDDRWPSLETLLDALQRAQDRDRRRRRLAITGLAATVGLAVWQPWRDATHCERDPAALSGAWDAQQRERLDDAFVRSQRAYLDEARGRVVTALDDFAERWHAARQQACEATRVHHERSDAAFDASMRCLDRRRDALAAVVQGVIAATDERAAHALDAALGLPAPEGCHDGLDETAQWPSDPEQRAKVEALARGLDETEAAFMLIAADDALRRLAGVIEELEFLQQPRLVARAQLLSCRFAQRVDEIATAERHCRAALLAAAQAGDDALAPSAWTQLMRVADGASGDEALRYRLAAEAAIARVGETPARQAQLEQSVGDVLARAGRASEGVAAYEQALQWLARDGNDDGATALSIRNSLGAALANQGDFAGARAAFEDVLARQQTLYGPRHPEVARTRMNLGGALVRVGEFDRAIDEFELAGMDLEAAYGVSNRLVGDAWTAMGAALATAGEPEAGGEWIEQALALFERIGHDHDRGYYYALAQLGSVLARLGEDESSAQVHERVVAGFDDHLDRSLLAQALTNAGSMRRVLGDLDAARTHLQRAVEVLEQTAGADAPALWQPRFRLGQVELAAGRFVEASAQLDRAAAILVQHPVRPSVMAEVELDRAAAWLGRADAAAARPIAERAGALADEAGNASLREEIDALLARIDHAAR
ncbi:MAG: tetratricopeptide repeat protein [Nannocystaceae bacterium]|nr:tetratricopeptide repeat protein [Nannocystaceae bacterium]